MNWIGWLACTFSLGILLFAGVKMWPFLKINKDIYSDFDPLKEGDTAFRVSADIANNGLSDIRIERFMIKIKNITHFLNIVDVKENGDINIYIRGGMRPHDKYSYYVLKQRHKANLRIHFTLRDEKIENDIMEALLIVQISPFPLFNFSFLKQKTQKFSSKKNINPYKREFI